MFVAVKVCLLCGGGSSGSSWHRCIITVGVSSGSVYSAFAFVIVGFASFLFEARRELGVRKVASFWVPSWRVVFEFTGYGARS